MNCPSSRKLISLLVPVLWLCGHGASAQSTKSTPKSVERQKGGGTAIKSANLAFGILKLEASATPLEQNVWEGYLTNEGLTPWKENMWHLEAADGEIRAVRTFVDQETTFSLLFFPSDATPLNEATLSWLYRTASSFNLEDGDGVELSFPQESLGNLAGFRGTREQSFLLSLSSGRLDRSLLLITWKH